MDNLSKVIFKGLLPFADVIEEVSDERGNDDGIWIYPVRATQAAEGICSPSQLHEDTIKTLIPQIRAVAKEIRANPDPPTCQCGHSMEWHEDECKGRCTLCSCGTFEEYDVAEEIIFDPPPMLPKGDAWVFVIDGKKVKLGQRIKSFRGEFAHFHGVAQSPSPGKGGKISVSWAGDRSGWEGVYYPSVFDGEIV